jgi:hypothetical protein
MMVNWYCSDCGNEFSAGVAPCQSCPNCGAHLTAGHEPFGYWDGFTFVPVCQHRAFPYGGCNAMPENGVIVPSN